MRAAWVSGVVALAAVAASWPALVVQSAAALEPGVHVDPGSPAAKEYALPVSQARGAGEGGGPEGTHEQLFGSGIKPPSSGSPRGGSPSGESGARRGAAKSAGTSSSGSGGSASGITPTQPPPLVRRVAGGRSSSGGGSSLLVLLGGGVVVIVLGAFAGVVLRHGRRPTSPA
jgi:hypothetical protein